MVLPLFLWINVSFWATEYLPKKVLSDILKRFHFHCEDISVIIIIIGCLSFKIYFQISVQIIWLFFYVDSQDAKGRTLLMNVSVSGKVQGSGWWWREEQICVWWTKGDGIHYNLLHWVVTFKLLLWCYPTCQTLSQGVLRISPYLWFLLWIAIDRPCSGFLRRK